MAGVPAGELRLVMVSARRPAYTPYEAFQRRRPLANVSKVTPTRGLMSESSATEAPTLFFESFLSIRAPRLNVQRLLRSQRSLNQIESVLRSEPSEPIR